MAISSPSGDVMVIRELLATLAPHQTDILADRLNLKIALVVGIRRRQLVRELVGDGMLGQATQYQSELSPKTITSNGVFVQLLEGNATSQLGCSIVEFEGSLPGDMVGF